MKKTEQFPLTPGKFLGLSRMTKDDFLTMIALDHRGSFKKLANPEHPDLVSFEQIVSMKKQLLSILGPESSAVLLDPEYGVFPSIYGHLLNGLGLLVSVEESGYGQSKGGRVTKLMSKWGVQKIKRLGADGVKLLLFYNPDYKRTARKGELLVKKIARECRKNDILFLLEPMSYSIHGSKDNPEFAKRKPELVIKTAERLSGLGIDILKSEFPADLKYEENKDRALEYAKQVDRATKVPWVILSEGAPYHIFRQQVLLASQAGASGFLAGRAIWQEALVSSDFAGFLRNESLPRLRELNNIVRAHATPLSKRLVAAEPSFHNYYKKY
jgi:tagatose 1,6-diphosphate aldolase